MTERLPLPKKHVQLAPPSTADRYRSCPVLQGQCKWNFELVLSRGPAGASSPIDTHYARNRFLGWYLAGLLSLLAGLRLVKLQTGFQHVGELAHVGATAGYCEWQSLRFQKLIPTR